MRNNFHTQAEIDAYFAAEYARIDREWAPIFALTRFMIAIMVGIFLGGLIFLVAL